MSVIGYIRVSSNKQTHEHQHFEIEQFAKKILGFQSINGLKKQSVHENRCIKDN